VIYCLSEQRRFRWFWMTLMTFKVIHLLLVFSRAIFRTAVQQLSWFELSCIGTFIIGAELTTVATAPDDGIYTRHSYNQHTGAGRGGSWAGAWMKIATVLAVEGLAVVGSRFWGHIQRSCVGRSIDRDFSCLGASRGPSAISEPRVKLRAGCCDSWASCAVVVRR